MKTYLSLILVASLGLAQAQKPTAHKVGLMPSGPTAVIDTTAGRIACRLFSKEAPATTANFIALATGTRDWTDPATSAPTHNKPFYDGTALIGVAVGISGGDRTGLQKGTAGPDTPAEKSAMAIKADRPGMLGMKVVKGEASSSLFVITWAANLEYTDRLAIFGLCDQPSIERVEVIAHSLAIAGNHPDREIGINHITIVPPGEALPAPAPDVPEASILPRFGAEPTPVMPAPEPTGPTAIIDTTMGTLTCKLFKETTVATANFIGLATGNKDWKNSTTRLTQHNHPFYNGLHFKRVIPDFMIQQSDRPGHGSGDGSIGFQFDNEIVPGLTFDRPGRLAYANAGPTTNDSEWFITSTRSTGWTATTPSSASATTRRSSWWKPSPGCLAMHTTIR